MSSFKPTSLLLTGALALLSFRASAHGGAAVLQPPRLNPVSYSGYHFENVQLVTDAETNNELEFRSYSIADADGQSALLAQIQKILAQNSDKEKARDWFSKPMKKTLEQTASLLAEIKKGTLSREDLQERKAAVLELITSYDTNFLRPLPKKTDFSDFSARLRQYIGAGDTPATNLVGKGSDLSFLDPADSSFWKKPQALAALDLYHGFGRRSLADLSATCEYLEPKTGYGVHAGFTMRCGKTEYKAKWGRETHPQPFNARILTALGYNTPVVDYFPNLRLRYDRHLFLDFNHHKALTTKITIFHGIPLMNIRVGASYLNPFEIVQEVHLKDGQVVAGEDFHQRLLNTQDEKAEQDEKNYQSDFESQIDFLVLKEGSAETKEKKSTNVGGWGWSNLAFYGDDQRISGSSLGHENRRELRGLGLLMAWLASNDTRWDNNKIRLSEQEDGTLVMRHLISDVGTGLGGASSLLSTTSGDANKFSWFFTVGPDSCRFANSLFAINRCRKVGFAVTKYQTLDMNDTFHAMSIDDAKWMARMIAQLTRSQIESALAASGYSQAEIELLTLKLLYRRDRMLWDLGLHKLPMLLNGKDVSMESRNFEENPLVIAIPGADSFRPPVKGCSLKKGTVKCPVGVFLK